MLTFSNFRFIWEQNTGTFRWLMWCDEKKKEYISYPGFELPAANESYLKKDMVYGLPLEDFLSKFINL